MNLGESNVPPPVDKYTWRPCGNCALLIPVVHEWHTMADGTVAKTGTYTYVCPHCSHCRARTPTRTMTWTALSATLRMLLGLIPTATHRRGWAVSWPNLKRSISEPAALNQMLLKAAVVLVRLLSSDVTCAQNAATQQVPGAAARLKQEYRESRTRFFDDDEAIRAPIIVSWHGELDLRIEQRNPLPENGVIHDQATLSRLWRDWRLGVVPTVDFERCFVLAALGGDSSARYEVFSKLKRTGDLQCRFIAADLVKKGDRPYVAFVVPRKGITAFNGRPIERPAQDQSSSQR